MYIYLLYTTSLQPQLHILLFFFLMNVFCMQATKSFKLCCKAAWNCVLHFCKTFTSSRDGFSSDLTEDTIVGFVTEACAKSAFLLDILYQCGSNKISKIFMDCLGSWSVGQSLFDQIPTPIALIKQWVKVSYKKVFF